MLAQVASDGPKRRSTGFVQPEDDMRITPDQCRAARTLLNLSQPDLAKAAGVGRATISRFESGERTPHAGNLAAIRAALEAAGVLFIDGDKTAGPGVRLREPQEE